MYGKTCEGVCNGKLVGTAIFIYSFFEHHDTTYSYIRMPSQYRRLDEIETITLPMNRHRDMSYLYHLTATYFTKEQQKIQC